MVEELNASGTTTARFVQGLGIDEPLVECRSGATNYYEADGLGSITSLTSSAGAVAKTYLYDSFGNDYRTTGTVTNPYQFTAREFDSETGLYYYRARYYDPTVGRFVSEDPLEFQGGDVNFYSYAGNNPVLYLDPFGLRALTACEKAKLKKYIPQVDLDEADLHTDIWPPRVWKLPLPLPADVQGITLENNIYLRPGTYDASTPEGLALLGHELVHVGQYAREGLSRSAYLKELLRHGSGEKNKYEKPAYEREREISRALANGKDECCSKK